ncbi:unnamed protein product [Paramecium primaurelia]|uniref:Uncharacterized protein n=1 Tax=Paramecium primaurelia TaxID=5886 RepID=A0A8S1NUK4_PARPR|nr:unnamed protein product [Paramecium primaurelia]
MNFYLNQLLIWDFYDKWERFGMGKQLDLVQPDGSRIIHKPQHILKVSIRLFFQKNQYRINLIFDEINRKIMRVNGMNTRDKREFKFCLIIQK